jgi:two-component system sensor histidine kinase CiaH
MFRSATFKLTMWYLALVVAISMMFSVVLYKVSTGELADGLHSQTERIFNQYPVFDDSPLLKSTPYDERGDHRILDKLVFINVVVFFMAGFASYWLARRTLEPIEHAHEQQKRFTADVSHELRTPLTALKMESEVTLMDPTADAEELRKTLTSNLEEVAKLETLINNLLRLTRLEANELQQNFIKIELSSVIDRAVKEADPHAKTRQIELITETNEIELYGDQDSLTQLVFIILDNAVKYSPNKSEIHITSTDLGEKVAIEIKDEGPGIDQVSLERVFDRFYRADNSRNKSEITGFGLGLSIAKMIADVHQGDIVINSKVGQGTSVRIILPKSVNN